MSCRHKDRRRPLLRPNKKGCPSALSPVRSPRTIVPSSLILRTCLLYATSPRPLQSLAIILYLLNFCDTSSHDYLLPIFPTLPIKCSFNSTTLIVSKNIYSQGRHQIFFSFQYSLQNHGQCEAHTYLRTYIRRRK